MRTHASHQSKEDDCLRMGRDMPAYLLDNSLDLSGTILLLPHAYLPFSPLKGFRP